ncbi:MAG: HEPN domain-containing protein [Tannerellaceae bacterium]|nr:HEPN domain-containing protein [Tannerellaceae bacterium]
MHKQAEEYYKEKHQSAYEFFDGSQYYYSKGWYKKASFNLHQTCENLFYAVRLVFTLENSKQHNLSKLLASVRKYSDKFEKIFPRKTDEEKRLFTLLKSAYVEARYNPKFVVTKNNIDSLFPIVNQLFDLVKEIYKERIEEYKKFD